MEIIEISGNRFILHLEFQSDNDSNMINRMLRYRVFLREKYKLSIRQVVVYFAGHRMSMKNKISEDQLDFSYELIDLKEIPCDEFLKSENPSEIIMTILCKMEKGHEAELTQEILKRLKARVKEEIQLSKYIRQLEVLAQLRDFQKTVYKEVNSMALYYDIEKDIRYIEGNYFGEFSLIDQQPRSASVQAFEDSTVFKLDIIAYSDLCRKHPEVETIMLKGFLFDVITKLRSTSESAIAQGLLPPI